MALQIVPGSSTDLVLATRRPEISEEEHQKRLKDAEELEKKLNYITEKARRREMMRQARFETEAVEQQANDEYETRQRNLRDQEESKTAKRKQKRENKRARKKRDVGSAEGAVDPHQNGSDQNDIDEPVQAALD